VRIKPTRIVHPNRQPLTAFYYGSVSYSLEFNPYQRRFPNKVHGLLSQNTQPKDWNEPRIWGAAVKWDLRVPEQKSSEKWKREQPVSDQSPKVLL
jgi:hypothetical protein